MEKERAQSSEGQCLDCVDLALGAHFFDPLAPEGKSPLLERLMEKNLPPWLTPTPYISIYSHYRLSLLT
ncbi:hypothetical protein Ciccas_004406 [Cichlidogyrus casuarinus]|uniref:Uncharacterized protein n=1 Tax=Cichlidogyrus casuarinus TaxID=1844966 RepID=A0ABD2QCJ5_9PLAT